MRVVLDTNILARAAHSPTGPAGEVLDRLQDPEHVLVLSSFILNELDRVLRYPRLQRLHGLDDDQIATYISNVEAASLIVRSPLTAQEPSLGTTRMTTQSLPQPKPATPTYFAR